MIKGDLESVLAQRCKDYVTVILTDKVDLDVIDMQDRLRLAFPGLLEIRRETVRQVDYTRHADSERELNPFELCCQFLGNADAEEQEILRGGYQYSTGGDEMRPVKLIMQAFGSYGKTDTDRFSGSRIRICFL